MGKGEASIGYPVCYNTILFKHVSKYNLNSLRYYADWFHGDAFGLTLDNARQLIGFKCHVCRDRTAPICPHMKINELSHTESNAATECAEELSNPVSLQPLSEVCLPHLKPISLIALETEMIEGQSK